MRLDQAEPWNSIEVFEVSSKVAATQSITAVFQGMHQQETGIGCGTGTSWGVQASQVASQLLCQVSAPVVTLL